MPNAERIGVVSFDTMLYGPTSTVAGVDRAARAAGYGLNIVTLEKVDRPGITAALSVLTERPVAGVVVVAPQRSAVAALRSIPRAVTAVAVECDSIDAARRLPAIGVDQRAGARLAATHLLELGHHRVWHVAGPADWLEARERTDGWRTTLHDAGLSTPPVLTGDWSARSGYRAGLDLARRFRADPDAVTAVFAANDHMALGVIRALQEHRIRVPEDISVVGFDDIPGAAYLSPPLTTIHQDFDEMGRRCVAALLRLAESDRVERPIPVAPTLVLRASTAAR